MHPLKKTILIILLTFYLSNVFSQQLSNENTQIFSYADTLTIEADLIVPGSIHIFSGEHELPDSLYQINYDKNQIIFRSFHHYSDSIIVNYRQFPLDLTSELYKYDFYATPVLDKKEPNLLYELESQEEELFSGFLYKNGSLLKGITIGNNQNASVQSNLNLQLNGMLSENIRLNAAISDKNIPIEADGTTQQLQEFDKVYIELSNSKSSLIAGDFELIEDQQRYLKLNKKVSGGLYSTIIELKNKKEIEINVGASSNKGIYGKNNIMGIEGNQGPYKLYGNKGERFIIISAGTERVYIDGQLMKRGKENDYIMNYNTSEITFTTNQIITKDSRIIVEFQYSERSYTRYGIFTNNSIKSEKGTFYLSFYSESDSKNQPVTQDLTDDQKELLSIIGDNLDDARILNIDSTNLDDDLILYTKRDTTIASGNTFTIFVYSTIQNHVRYRVGFSYVGENKGNYILSKNITNGKVYEWTAPLNGTPQGNYEPVTTLTTPKSNQILTMGGDYKLFRNSNLKFDLAATHYDQNTFSSINDNDNYGFAFSSSFMNNFYMKDTIHLIQTRLFYQLKHRDFHPVERVRHIEFERNWNIQEPIYENQHLGKASVTYVNQESGFISYNFDILEFKNIYSGYNHNLSADLNYEKYLIDFDANYLTTHSDYQTSFFRQKSSITRKIKHFNLSLKTESEKNLWELSSQPDSLFDNSFSFFEYGLYLESPDTFKNSYKVFFSNRDDYLPCEGKLESANRAFEAGSVIDIKTLKNQHLALTVTYRNLEINDTLISREEKPEETILSSLQYNFNLFKGILRSRTYIEAGSGLEPKHEFSYIEVAHGQGLYKWIDYNGNQIKEINEFEIAYYQDEANYIRVFTPSTTYINTNNNQFSQTFNIDLHRISRYSDLKIVKFLSRFSDQFSFHNSEKVLNTTLLENLNPFDQPVQTSVINKNYNLRNQISFNKRGKTFGGEYIYLLKSLKRTLYYGYEETYSTQHLINLRYRLNSGFTIFNTLKFSSRSFDSESFNNKNYLLDSYQELLKFQFEYGKGQKTDISYSYSDLNNLIGTERAFINRGETTTQYRFKEGYLNISASYIHINYHGNQNNSISYEIMQGLKNGNNLTWNISMVKKLKYGFEILLNYSGRKNENHKAIHTGNLSIRAVF